jgi:hypothetical protein
MTDMHGVIQSAQVDDVIVIGMHNIIWAAQVGDNLRSDPK